MLIIWRLVLTYRGILVSYDSGIPEGCVYSMSVWWKRMQIPM